MYRRPKFLEVLLEIRQEMAREADYDVDLFAEMVRSGSFSSDKSGFNLTELKSENKLSGKSNKKPEIAKRKSQILEMEIAFDAIGLEIPNETAIHDLAEDVGKRGEVSLLPRKDGVLHGRCLKFGSGLEVWTLYYESGKGEMVYTDCRPAFRARYAQKIAPWSLTESDKDGKSVIHGFIEDTNTEVLFQLQNLTEVGTRFLEQTTLHVGLCGLAYRAGIFPKNDKYSWKLYDEAAVNVIEDENYWNVAGHILAFDTIRNPQSGNDLYWIYVGMGGSQLEILVNHRALRGRKPQIGAFVEADIWLQGHILNESAKRNGYEGVDWSTRTADFWTNLKKPN